MEDKTEGKMTLIKHQKGWTIHLDDPLNFSRELALTDKEMERLQELIVDYNLSKT